MMKSQLVLALFFFVGFSAAADLATMEKIAEKCRHGTSVTKDLITMLLKNNEPSASVEEPTKCYFKCLLMDVGLMHADGKIELDADHQHFSDCAKSTNDEDMCDKAYNFHQCIHAQHPDLPIF